MRCVLAGAVALIVLAAAAGAQEADGQNEAPARAPASELDRLSRSADDPFAGVIKAERREPVSVTLRALDKITARYSDLEVEMNQIARFGSLELQPRSCDKRPPEEFPETTAFLEIFDTELGNRASNLKPRAAEAIEDHIEASDIGALDVAPAGDLPDAPDALAPAGAGPDIDIFRGWMFASSPALNPLEHAVYDVWVIDCKTRLVDN